MNRADRRACGQRRGRYEPSNPLARLMRPTCTVCDAPVQWLPWERALDLLGTDRLVEMRAGLQTFDDEALVAVDVWKCSSCDQFGMLGGAAGGWS